MKQYIAHRAGNQNSIEHDRTYIKYNSMYKQEVDSFASFD